MIGFTFERDMRTSGSIFLATMMVSNPDTVHLIHSDSSYDSGNDPKESRHDDPG